MRKTIGILGGMGPLATADLLIKITTATSASSDREHIRVYIDSNAAIPDRTAAILEGGPDPVPEMADALGKLTACGADCVLIACNTAHYFLPRLQPLTQVPILDMLAITARSCATRYPGRRAAILATTGTLRTGLYARALAEAGVPWLLPDEEQQRFLMHLIYDVVKATRPMQPEEPAWRELLEALRARGADYFILACTELPIVANTIGAEGPFVDPTEELARAAVAFCGYPVQERQAEAPGDLASPGPATEAPPEDPDAIPPGERRAEAPQEGSTTREQQPRLPGAREGAETGSPEGRSFL